MHTPATLVTSNCAFFLLFFLLLKSNDLIVIERHQSDILKEPCSPTKIARIPISKFQPKQSLQSFIVFFPLSKMPFKTFVNQGQETQFVHN